MPPAALFLPNGAYSFDKRSGRPWCLRPVSQRLRPDGERWPERVSLRIEPEGYIHALPELRRGFTLVEFIVGIVLLAVALTGILGLLINQAPQAVDPCSRCGPPSWPSASSAGAAKSFDERSDHSGGRFRCGETAGTPPVTYPYLHR